jgi:hypothetical protein
MNYFLVEIPLQQPDGMDIGRATRTLHAAQARLSHSAITVRPLAAGVTSGDGRLVCLMEAGAAEQVRSLVSLALLPAGRIREVLRVPLIRGDRFPSAIGWLNPGADLAPRVDTELVEDVVEVRFDGPLGDE